MKNAAALFALFVSVCLWTRSDTVTDWYRFRMSLKVPRVYDNSDSRGYRKYQRQTLSGYMSISYDGQDAGSAPTVAVSRLENQKHRIGGRKITYECTVDDGSIVLPRVNYVGDNGAGRFRTPTVVFHLDAEPSYNVGEDDEDNSLFVTVSGHGASFSRKVPGGTARIPRRFSGAVAGTLGCGCRAYGHVSPTRVAGPCGATDAVDDVAPVHGTWKARFVTRNGSQIWYR